MNKILELEKKLIAAKDELLKIMPADSTMPGSVNTTSGPSIASQIGFGKAEKELSRKQKKLDHDGDGDIEADDLAALRSKKGMKKAEHPDEKEDKKLIADALDRHNEQKHGEPKKEDSAKKAMKISKKEDEEDEGEESEHWANFRDGVRFGRIKDRSRNSDIKMGGNPGLGEESEEEAAEREEALRRDPRARERHSVEDAPPKKLYKSEQITYLPNGQWSLEKARILKFPEGKLLADLGEPAQTTAPAGNLRIANETDKPSRSARPVPPKHTEMMGTGTSGSGAHMSADPAGDRRRALLQEMQDMHPLNSGVDPWKPRKK